MRVLGVYFPSIKGAAISIFSDDHLSKGKGQLLKVENMGIFNTLYELITNYTLSAPKNSYLCVITKTETNPNGSECLCTFNHIEPGRAEICVYNQATNSGIHALTCDDATSLLAEMQELIETFNIIKKGGL